MFKVSRSEAELQRHQRDFRKPKQHNKSSQYSSCQLEIAIYN